MAEDMTPLETEGKKRKKSKKPKKEKQVQSSGSPLQGIRSWLVDSYNGIFKIVVQPLLPKPRVFGFMLLAALLGLIWAYAIDPVSFFDAGPHQLSQSQRDQYVILVAGANSAGLYSQENIIRLLEQVENPGATVSRLIQSQSGQVQFALQELEPLAQQAGRGQEAPGSGNILQSIMSFVIALVVLVIAIVVFSLVWGLLIGGYVERFLARLRPKTDADRAAEQVKHDIERRRQLQKDMVEQSKREAQTSDLGPAIMQRVSPYTKGRAYDDSFAIEDANDVFLGECGATIAKTIGDTQELAAIEIWLFDKEDFVRTLTKILASEHAMNDPVIRSELEAKVENPATDIIRIELGAILTIDTDQIRVQAKVADVTPGTNPALPPNSHFDALTLQMVAWQKTGSPAPVAAPVPAASGLPDLSSYEIGPPPQMPPSPGGLPDLSSYEIGPPPQMPSEATQPSSPATPAPYNPAPSLPPLRPQTPGGGIRPLAPPSSLPQQDDDYDDDPFGGTGDFTPIGS